MDLMCDFWLSNQPMPRPSCQGGFTLIKGIRSEWGIPLFSLFWHEYDEIRGETQMIWKNSHFPQFFNRLKAFKMSKSVFLMLFWKYAIYAFLTHRNYFKTWNKSQIIFNYSYSISAMSKMPKKGLSFLMAHLFKEWKPPPKMTFARDARLGPSAAHLSNW